MMQGQQNVKLLMMGIMVPETCWADNKFSNKIQYVASSWPSFSTYLQRCTVKLTWRLTAVFDSTKSCWQIQFNFEIIREIIICIKFENVWNIIKRYRAVILYAVVIAQLTLLPLGGKTLPRYMETEDMGIKVFEHLSRESQGCNLICLSRWMTFCTSRSRIVTSARDWKQDRNRSKYWLSNLSRIEMLGKNSSTLQWSPKYKFR
jgi:hypothetical protein